MKIFNKKGYVTAILAMLGIVLMGVASISFIALNNISKSHQTHTAAIQEYYNVNSVSQRAFAKLYSNISYSKPMNYADLGQSFSMTDVSVDEQAITYNIYSGSVTVPIYNSTDIMIETNNYSKNDPDKPASYTITVTAPNNDVIYEQSSSGTMSHIISANSIYDKSTDTMGTGYGDYTVTLNISNCDVTLDVNYTKLNTRTVKVNNNTFLISNTESCKNQIILK